MEDKGVVNRRRDSKRRLEVDETSRTSVVVVHLTGITGVTEGR